MLASLLDLEETYRIMAVCSPSAQRLEHTARWPRFVALSRLVSRTDRSVFITSPRRQDVATRAYILVEAKAGKACRLARTLRCVPEVESADVVTGACDLIVVTKRIQATDSVAHITTCLAMTGGRSD